MGEAAVGAAGGIMEENGFLLQPGHDSLGR